MIKNGSKVMVDIQPLKSEGELWVPARVCFRNKKNYIVIFSKTHKVNINIFKKGNYYAFPFKLVKEVQ